MKQCNSVILLIMSILYFVTEDFIFLGGGAVLVRGKYDVLYVMSAFRK